MRAVAAALSVLALAGCGGGTASPQLADGSDAGALPATLADFDNGVLTRTRVRRAAEIDPTELRACGVPAARDTPVVERVGIRGSSLTFSVGRTWLNGCGSIPDPARDPDRPFGGTWCGVSVGFVVDGALRDPRLSLCTNEEGELTAFVWVEPRPAARWVVVTDGGTREVYETAASLPVRVTTTHGIRPEGSASFAVEEYDPDGNRLRAYELEARVAG